MCREVDHDRTRNIRGQGALAYAVHPVPASEVAEQRASYTALLQSLGRATFEEIETAMEGRESTPPERELSPQVIQRLRDRISQA